MSSYVDNKIDLTNVKLEIERIFGDDSFILDDIDDKSINESMIVEDENNKQTKVSDVKDEILEDINDGYYYNDEPIVIKSKNNDGVDMQLLNLGISVINQSSNQVEFRLNNDVVNFDFIAMALICFVGKESLDVIFSQDKDGLNIRIRNSSQHNLVFGDNDFCEFIFKTLYSFNGDSNNYVEQLNKYPSLFEIFKIFQKSFSECWNVKIGYKKRSGLDQFAIITNQQVLINAIKDSQILLEEKNGYSKAIIGDNMNVDELESVLSKISTKISEQTSTFTENEGSILDVSEMLKVVKKDETVSELNETAHVNSIFLTMIAIFDLIGICIGICIFFLH